MPPKPRRLARDAHNAHLFVGDFSALDDHVVVERHRAVAHRHVIVALGGALAAALRVRAGREQEVSGKAAVYVSLVVLSRNAFPTTETELKLMAAAATIGFNSRCDEIG